MTDDPTHPPAMLRFTKLPHPVDDRLRFPLRHEYLEVVYMPLIGATAVALLRRLDLLLTKDHDTVETEPAAFARELGLRSGNGGQLGDHSSLMKTLGRLSRHNLVTRPTRWHVGVYSHVPALDATNVRRLPEPARRIHHLHLRNTKRTTD